ncbi:Lrp/AsnC family transcriptional regulator [Bifidobacterium cuniculi]|uniref:AsnC-type transcriptional regulator n=1 Tax=Bifidobacterium cuniculi TaxID=1688 RepID=A0A087B550_9BIFI|nr:Lrp/AsnC family transcriptional regulator [Bifidobacterium cuniculi]KFI66150.1 AsnC-type transcriptional regulator [Bifidobacterium cuniculi]
MGTDRSGGQPPALDEKDDIILSELEHDGRATLAQLAQAASLSVSATQSRVQKLERHGVIEGYRAIVNHDKGADPVRAFVTVTPLDYAQEQYIPERLAGVHGIITCDAVSGSPSYMLTVSVPDSHHLEELLNTIHRTVPVSTETTIVLHRYFAQ